MRGSHTILTRSSSLLTHPPFLSPTSPRHPTLRSSYSTSSRLIMASYICCCTHREDPTCALAYCPGCSPTCCAANWLHACVGIPLTIFLLYLPWIPIIFLIYLATANLKSETETETAMYWVRYVLLALQVVWDIAVLIYVSVSVWRMKGPGAQHAGKIVRVGTPWHGKFAWTATVLLALSCLWNVITIVVASVGASSSLRLFQCRMRCSTCLQHVLAHPSSPLPHAYSTLLLVSHAVGLYNYTSHYD